MCTISHGLHLLLLAALAGGLGAGCATTTTGGADKFQRPTIAILEFENKAPFGHGWNLGQGMRDELVNELVKSGRYTVLTREDLAAVVAELEAQRDPHFRKEGRVSTGRLKNCQYLIKGAVTDFGHVAGGGFRAVTSKLGLGGTTEIAIVALTLYVIKVETGEILASKSLEGRISAGSANVDTTYKGVSFGGGAFYRTPLGRATKEVMGQALGGITETIARQRWYPVVVSVDGPRLIMSGGTDRGQQVGSRWTAYAAGEELFDPTTGDSLGHKPERSTGHVRISEVREKYSVAEIEDGQFTVGQELRAREP